MSDKLNISPYFDNTVARRDLGDGLFLSIEKASCEKVIVLQVVDYRIFQAKGYLRVSLQKSNGGGGELVEKTGLMESEFETVNELLILDDGEDYVATEAYVLEAGEDREGGRYGDAVTERMNDLAAVWDQWPGLGLGESMKAERFLLGMIVERLDGTEFAKKLVSLTGENDAE